MSTWGVAQLAQWAYGAGWRKDAVETAVAVAEAVSGGNDHYVSPDGYPPQLVRRGLYALTEAEAAPTSVGELFDPVANTAAAFRRWTDAGGVWSWHPVWASGAAVQALPHVRAVLASPRTQPGPGAPARAAAMLDYTGRFTTAMQQLTRRQG